ncbi:MAG TPA: VWA domain-containing protein [Vicinamibacterales bacterium]|nr:VWA domain-containing protein [Vicinamibacterales bacterium]
MLTALPLLAQTPQFRATSELIEVQAVVTDKSGTPARGLTRDDFVVTEDGVRQEIAQFHFVDLPPPVAAQERAPSLTPATTANNHIPRDGRLYVIVLDAFHVDSSQSANVRKYARQFITESIGADDAAAVVTLGGMSNQPFTKEKARLLRAVDGFIGRSPGRRRATSTSCRLSPTKSHRIRSHLTRAQPAWPLNKKLTGRVQKGLEDLLDAPPQRI